MEKMYIIIGNILRGIFNKPLPFINKFLPKLEFFITANFHYSNVKVLGISMFHWFIYSFLIVGGVFFYFNSTLFANLIIVITSSIEFAFEGIFGQLSVWEAICGTFNIIYSYL